MSAGEQETIFTLVAERLVVQQRRDVETQVLGIIGERIDEFLE
jgi:hypothetical protein